MNAVKNKQLAQAQNISEEVLPYYHELLADLWEMGSFPDHIATMLETLYLPPYTSHILDLGCGKGAVTITLAEKLGVKVDGYDLYQSFLDEALQKAKEHRVVDLCRFEVADIHDTVQKARDYDVVIFAAPGPVFGNLKQTVGQLRQTVRQGGYILINEGFAREDKKIDIAGYDYVQGYDSIVTHEKSLQQLTAYGDKLLQEVIVPKSAVIAANKRNNEAIAKRATELTKRFPENTHIFADFVLKEKDECEVIERTLQEAIWLLQKS
jgi:cyclopropane fatty-acyl-phospholipid synthase-like methyltransferase